jgi:hypothetical protein
MRICPRRATLFPSDQKGRRAASIEGEMRQAHNKVVILEAPILDGGKR